MRKMLRLVVFAGFSMVMTFPSFAATKLETPDIRWSPHEEAVMEWSRPDEECGKYQLEVRKDGAYLYNRVFYIFQDQDREWHGSTELRNYELEEGSYTFRVRALGDDVNTYSSRWSDYSEPWTFALPEEVLDAPVGLYWDETTVYWEPSETLREQEEYLAGYEVCLYEDDSRFFTNICMGPENNSYNVADKLSREDDRRYTFSVRAISRDPSVFANSELAVSEDACELEWKDVRAAHLLDALQKNEDELLWNAPNILGSRKYELTQAMNEESELFEQVRSVEEAYQAMYDTSLQLEASDEVPFDAEQIQMTGGLLNAGKDSGVILKVEVPKLPMEETAEARTIPVREICLDFQLGDSTEDLKVPVHLAMPIPECMEMEGLSLVHIDRMGETRDVALYEVDAENQRMSFVMEGTGSYVLTGIEAECGERATSSNADLDEGVSTSSNADQDREVNTPSNAVFVVRKETSTPSNAVSVLETEKDEPTKPKSIQKTEDDPSSDSEWMPETEVSTPSDAETIPDAEADEPFEPESETDTPSEPENISKTEESIIEEDLMESQKEEKQKTVTEMTENVTSSNAETE